jgi:DNA integrity scanning protein DisA with diadenylate cyclase activity
LLDFGRLAELLGYDRKVNTLDYPVSPRGYRILGRIPRLPKLVVQNIVREFRGLDEILAATDPELESVDGVARSGRRTSARAFAAYRRSTSWTATCRRELHGATVAP